MSLFEQQRPAPFGAESVYKITLFFEKLFDRTAGRVKSKLAADRTFKALSALSAHQLRDIGLGETDLAEFSRSSARRRY